MKLFRFIHNGEINYGALDGAELALVRGDVYGDFEVSDRRVKMSEVEVLAPTAPSKVVALGLNYRDHAKEMGQPIPEEPIVFMKPATAVVGPGENIIYPAGGITSRVDYEAELGIVIGKKAKNVKTQAAADYILGYTCVNDVTARDLQARDGQWTRAKSFDTFCPIGPCIETELDTADLKVRAVLNGKTVQESSTRELIFNVPKIVELISQVMTLLPGDVIHISRGSGRPDQPGQGGRAGIAERTFLSALLT